MLSPPDFARFGRSPHAVRPNAATQEALRRIARCTRSKSRSAANHPMNGAAYESVSSVAARRHEALVRGDTHHALRETGHDQGDPVFAEPLAVADLLL